MDRRNRIVSHGIDAQPRTSSRARIIWCSKMKVEIEIYTGGESRLYLFVLDVSGYDWEVEEIWWLDSPISLVDPQGTLMVEETIQDGVWFVRGYGEDATADQVYTFWSPYEEELQQSVNELRQEMDRDEAYAELIGV